MVFTQSDFERTFAPAAEWLARKAFRKRHDREELVNDTISECWRMLQTAPAAATPGSIAVFAVLRVKQGRQFEGSARCLMGPNPRRKAKADRGEFDVDQVGKVHDDPADLAALRIDFPAWLESLNVRNQQVVVAMLRGDSNREISERFGVSQARVSQLRRLLVIDWEAQHS